MKKSICLNMIVKNESAVIKRCLESIKPLLDYWVIMDTGSTDGTQELIKEILKGIPGELHERPWKNFGESRTEALELAKGKGDYLLFIDADDILEFDGEKKFPHLTADLYQMWRGTKEFSYIKPQLVRSTKPWKWIGVTHEYLDCNEPYSTEILQNVRYVSCDGGARSNGTAKFWENIFLLTEGLKKEPHNARYAFYLAESYRDAGEKGKALEWYQKRIDMGGWLEEIFWSKLQIAHLLKEINLPQSAFIESYWDAHRFRPHRAEPLYYLAEIYNNQKEHQKAYQCLKMHAAHPKPTKKDILFNHDWIEQYGLLFQLSICAYYVGNYQEALDACDKLLKIKNLPNHWRTQAEINRTFPLAKLTYAPC